MEDFRGYIQELTEKTCNLQETSNLRLENGAELKRHLLQGFESETADKLLRQNVKFYAEAILPMLDKMLNEQDKSIVEMSINLIATLMATCKQDATPLFDWFVERVNTLKTNTGSASSHAASISQLLFCIQVMKQYLEISQQQMKKTSKQIKLTPDSFNSQISTIVKTSLELLQEIELIPPMLTILEHIAKYHMTLLRSHFQDIVDILVGWYLDRETPAILRNQIGASFMSFTALWISEKFTAGLLEKFISDMKVVEERDFYVFVSCFIAVVRALGNLFAVCAPKLLNNLVDVFETVTEKNKKVWKTCSECLLSIAQELRKELLPYLPRCLEFYTSLLQTPSKFEVTNDWTDSIIHLLSVVSKEITLVHIEPLLSSIALYVQHNPQQHAIICFSYLYKMLLIDFPAETSRVILGYMFSTVPRIPKHATFTEYTQTKPFLPKLFDSSSIPKLWSRDSEMSAIFYFAVLANVLSMNDVDSKFLASFMDFILRQNELWVPVGYFSPKTLAGFIRKLKQAYERLHTVIDKDRTATMIDVIVLISSISPVSLLKIETLQWIESIISIKGSNVKSNFRDVFENMMPFLKNSTMDEERKVRAKAISCIGKGLQGLHGENSELFFDSLRIIFQSLSDITTDVSTQALLSISEIVPALMNEKTWNNFKLWCKTAEKEMTRKKATNSGFKSRQFGLLLQQFMPISSQPLSECLQLLYSICNTSWNSVHPNHETALPEPNYSLESLERWVITEAARNCVNNRLRTILGGAGNTFESLEKLLKRVGTVEQSSKPEKLEDVISRFDKIESNTKAKLFLNFMDELEKQITLSAEVYKTADDDYSKNTLLFFASNKKVCEDWFSRLRPTIMQTSYATKAYSAIIRNAMIKLQEIRSRSPQEIVKTIAEYEQMLLILGSVLVETGDSDTLEGLQSWHKGIQKQVSQFAEDSAQDPRLSAIGAAIRGLAFEAKGMYQNALREFTEELFHNDTIKLLENKTITIVIDHVVSCYSHLNSWKQLSSWLEWLKQYREHGKLDERVFSPSTDLSYLFALANYDSENFQGSAQELDRLVAPKDNLAYVKLLLLDGMIKHTDKRPPFHRIQNDIANGRMAISNALSSMTSASASQLIPHLSYLCSLGLLEKMNQSKLSEHDFRAVADSHINSARQLDFFNDISRVLRAAQSKMESSKVAELKSLLLLKKAKLARKHQNFSQAKDLLSMLNKSSLAFRYGTLLLARSEKTADEESIIEQMCTILFEKENSTHSEDRAILSSISMKIEKWICEDPNRRREFVELIFGEKRPAESDMSEYLLEKAISFSDQKRVPLIKFAHWCYSHSEGSKVIQPKHKDEIEAILKKIVVTDDDEELSAVQQVISQAFERLLSSNSLTREMFDLEFMDIEPRAGIQAHADDFFNLLQRIRKNRDTYHQKAIQSFFKALNIREKLSDEKYRETNVTIALHLLRFFTQCAHRFEKEILHGIDTTPPYVWSDIIPQVLAHLGNADSSVQKIIKHLLIKIGKETPQLVVYPVIVGSRTNKGPFKQYKELVAEMSKHSSDIVQGVQLLIGELARITMLWEEIWLSSIQSIHRRLRKQFNAFKIARGKILEKHTNLSEEERSNVIISTYTQFMNPVLVVLDEINKLTTELPATRHEHEFQDKYEMILARTLRTLKSPPNSETLDQDVEQAIEVLFQLGRKHAHIYRKGQLKLSNISPILANMKSSHIPIPGVEREFDPCLLSSSQGKYINLPTISSFEADVDILSSKTRPKKLSMVGSDGKRYTFLLKGKEDLHLDERVMQFLRIVNLLLSSTSSRSLRAREYAVVPLGDRSGLIRWVDGAFPIFSLHRDWFNRKTQLEQMKNDSKKKPQQAQAMFRPVEMFFNKLIPALKEQGIQNPSYPYPKDVLKGVLKQLMAEMPRDILAKEIWLSSKNYDDWWDRTKIFNRSVGVMSMIGYIIGLGDRHLDNILVDQKTSEVVHIDYNVCFDKGLRLRVPEVVPFRMTPVIQSALGLTGVEGTFRISCEETLTAMRNAKDTLLMLLEAFVYDPLVDWTSETVNDDVYGVEVKVSLGIFTSRFLEIEQKMKAAFSTLALDLERIGRLYKEAKTFYDENGCAKLKDINSKFVDLRDELQSLGYDVENFNVDKSTTRLPKVQEAKLALRNVLNEECNKYTSLCEVHQGLFNSIQDGMSMKQLHTSAISPGIIQQPLLSQVLQILSSNVSQAKLKECSVLENALTTLLKQRETVLDAVLRFISEYRQVIVKFNSWDYMERNKSYILSKAITEVLNNPTKENVESCIQVFESTEQEKQLEKDQLHRRIVDLRRISTQLAEFHEQYGKGSGVAFLEKSVSESKRGVLEFLEQQGKTKNAPQVYHYIVGYVLRSLLDLVDGQRPKQSQAEASFFGDLDDANSELLEDEPTTSVSTDNAKLDHFAEEKDSTAQLIGWDKLLKLTRMVSHLQGVIQIEGESSVGISLSTQTPTNQQLSVLATSLQSNLRAIPELINNFIEVIFPETVTALKSGDSKILNMLNAFVAIHTAMIQGKEESLLKESYHALTDISSEMNAGKVLLAAYEGVFSKIEAPFKEFSSVIDADSILFREKVVCITDIVNGLIRCFDAQYIDPKTLYKLHNSNLIAIKGYVDKLITLITIPTLQTLLSTWGVSDSDYIAVLQQNAFAQSSKIMEKRTTDTCNIILNNLLASQRALDEEKFRVYVVEFQERYLQSLEQDAKSSIALFAWNRNQNGAVDEFVREKGKEYDYLLQRKKILDDIRTNVNHYNTINNSLKQLYIKYNEVEKEVSGQLGRLTSFSSGVMEKKYEVWKNSINERRSILVAAFQSDHALSTLCTGILQMEELRSKSEQTENLQRAVLKLIKDWRHVVAEEAALTELAACSNDFKVMKQKVGALDTKFSSIVIPLLQTAVRADTESAAYTDILRDVGSMLDSLVKTTKNFKKWNSSLTTFEAYLNNHDESLKNFMHNLMALLDPSERDIGQLSVTDEWNFNLNVAEFVSTTTSAANYVETQFRSIYEQAQKRQQNIVIDESQQAFQQDENHAENGETSIHAASTTITGNSYAIGVLKRVQSRLEANISVAEQVQNTIMQATSVDKLCVMYEGWTPWI